MMTKKFTLAALTAAFIAGTAGIANAEGGISSATSDEGSSAALEADYSATHENTGPAAYGYVRHHVTPAPVHKSRPIKGTMQEESND